MTAIVFERHASLARAEQAAGEAFGFLEPDGAAAQPRLRLLWLGSMTSAIAGLVTAAAVYAGF